MSTQTLDPKVAEVKPLPLRETVDTLLTRAQVAAFETFGPSKVDHREYRIRALQALHSEIGELLAALTTD